MIQRSWVRIPAQYTGWTFVVKIECLLEKTKINEKYAGDGPFKKDAACVVIVGNFQKFYELDDLSGEVIRPNLDQFRKFCKPTHAWALTIHKFQV